MWLGILAEIGNDMDVFPTHAHPASLAGVCPGNNESAGKKKSSRVTQGNKHLKTTLVEAAWTAAHSKTTLYLLACLPLITETLPFAEELKKPTRLSGTKS